MTDEQIEKYRAALNWKELDEALNYSAMDGTVLSKALVNWILDIFEAAIKSYRPMASSALDEIERLQTRIKELEQYTKTKTNQE